MTAELTWTNQPGFLRGLPIVFTGNAGDGTKIVEVRAGDDCGPWYITAGDLFSSATVQVPTAAAALRVMSKLFAGEKVKVGVECVLVPVDAEGTQDLV